MQVEVGMIFDGKVTGITAFGAFVDIGNSTTGLVHISEVASEYVKDINEHISVNDKVKVKVVSIDEKVFELRELVRNKRFSENFNEVDTAPKSKAHIPDMRHPWKMEQFRKQQRRARLQHLYA